MKKKFRKIKISSKSDLIKIKNSRPEFDHIEIDTRSFKYCGLLRHAFKYALWSIPIGGVIEVIDEPGMSGGISNNRVDFWQVRSEMFRSIGGCIETQDIDFVNGIMRAVKISDRYINSGITFSIIFGGAESELPMLINQLKSIKFTTRNICKNQFEINLIVSSEFNRALIYKYLPDIEINYTDFDDILPNKRIPIGKKKNLAISSASHNIVVISHTRMIFSDNFAENLLRRKFDLVSPEVFCMIKNKKHRYIDITFTGSYDYTRKNTTKVFSSYNIPASYMDLFKKCVAYLDGGITIVNKSVLDNEIYCNHLAWGEGEDVDMAGRAYASGHLLDLDPTLTCFSQTSNHLNPDFKLYIKHKLDHIKKFLNNYF